MEKIAGEIRQETPMSRVAFASSIGTMIEFYDFYIYGFAAALATRAVSSGRGPIEVAGASI